MNLKKSWPYWIAVLLLFPALLINLGLLAFIDDEGIRSLVALEMDLSGNLITPTLHGSYYYKKPPLYNWILLSWYQISGSISEFYARIPTIFALLGYAASLFFILKPKYGTKFAFLNAMFLITCGRILFWDSMLALIDMTFSWVTFLLFMVIYHYFEKEKYWHLFLISYLLTAVGFLLKGLPAIVFQGTTLLFYFAYRRRFLKLFSIQHILSGLLCVGIIASYYLIYHQYNSLENVFSTLFTESSKRTAAHFGIWKTIQHLVAFPFEMIYHFLPWTIFVILFFKKKIRQIILADRFITYCLLAFLANIIVYWSSPEVYPRYLLMHTPLIFIVYLYLFKIHKKENTLPFKIIDRLFLGICILISLASIAPLFVAQTQATSYLIPKTLFGASILIGATLGYYFKRDQRLLFLVIFLLGFRIVFNFFVLPDRNKNDYGDVIRQNAIKIGTTYQDQNLYVYKDSEMEPAISFYLTNARQAIIPRKYEDFGAEDLYVIDTLKYPGIQYEKIDELRLRHGERPIHIVGKLK